jgi:hypothetical protein
MRKKNLEVYQLALKMAGSGKFKDWKGIRDGLVDKGYKRAPDLLDDNKIRTILDIHCRQSKGRKTLEADLSAACGVVGARRSAVFPSFLFN